MNSCSNIADFIVFHRFLNQELLLLLEKRRNSCFGAKCSRLEITCRILVKDFIGGQKKKILAM